MKKLALVLLALFVLAADAQTVEQLENEAIRYFAVPCVKTMSPEVLGDLSDDGIIELITVLFPQIEEAARRLVTSPEFQVVRDQSLAERITVYNTFAELMCRESR